MDRQRRGLRWALLRMMSLGALFACLAAPNLALGQTALQQNNEGLDLIPLNITNNVTNTAPLYVYIKGILATNSNSYRQGQTVYVTDVNGNVAITPAIPVDAPITLGFNVGTAKSTAMMLPRLDSMRLYFSLGNGLLVQTNNQQGAEPSSPCGWCGTGNVENSTNFNTIFDWAELAWTGRGSGPASTMGGNVTEVDMFGMPLLLTLEGTDPASGKTTTQYAGFNDKRPTILNAYASLGSPWTGLMLSNASNTRMRIIAPYHGIPLGLFPANALDSYIAQVWSFYRTNPMRVSHACGQDGGILHNFTAQVSGNPASLVFSENGVAKFQFSMPSTLSVYQNEIGTLVSFPQGQMTELNMCLAQGVAAKLGGAFLRTNLLVNTNLDACQVSQFYKNTPIQQYAQIFHQFGIDGLAYSFGYDDTCSQSSYITVIAPTAVSVTISGTQ